MTDRWLEEVTAENSARLYEQSNPEPTLNHGGGGGTSGGMTDDWKDAVDRKLGELHGDIRDVLKAGIAGMVIAAGLIAGLYFYLNSQVDELDGKIVAVQVAQTKIDGRIDVMNAKLDILIERSKLKP